MVSPDEELWGASVPLPGVIGPLTDESGGAVCGIGALGMGALGGVDCCWAGLMTQNPPLKLKQAASKIAVHPDFTNVPVLPWR